MAAKKTAVLGIYPTVADARCAVETLIHAGFEDREISILLPAERTAAGPLLAEMGVPDYEVRRYEERVRDGGNLLSVRCESADQIRLARAIVRESGAHDIARRRPDIMIGELPLRRVRTTSLA
jgi:hypothetical protein